MANVSSSNGLEKYPKLRFKGFSEPWKKTPFSKLYRYVSEKNDGSLGVDKIISVANMYFKPDARISDEEYLRTYNVFRLGDIAFEGNKSKNFAFGRFVENTIGDGIVSHVFVVFRPLHHDHNLGYWKYAINNENVMGRILARCTKKTTMMTNLVSDDFLEEEMFCPSNAEQRKISSFLELLERKIDAQIKLVEHLKKYKRGASNSFFNDKAVSNSSSVLPFGQTVEINPKTKSLPTDFIYIDLESVESGKLLHKNIISHDNAPSRAQRVLSKGDVLFQMVRPYQKNNFYFESELSLPSVASTGYAQIRCNDNDPLFVFEQISSDYFSNQAMLRSTGTGYPAINADSLAEIPFIKFPIEEQRKIGKFLYLLSQRIVQEESKLDSLFKVKAAMLQSLFI